MNKYILVIIESMYIIFTIFALLLLTIWIFTKKIELIITACVIFGLGIIIPSVIFLFLYIKDFCSHTKIDSCYITLNNNTNNNIDNGIV